MRVSVYLHDGSFLSHSRPDDAEKYHGGPASVQLLGRAWEEEKLLSMAQVVIDALHRYHSRYR